jgi:hypothetical protein
MKRAHAVKGVHVSLAAPSVKGGGRPQTSGEGYRSQTLNEARLSIKLPT